MDHQLATYHPRKPQVYGALSSPITVTVQGGFLRPGTYHMPQGTTLGDLLKKARLADIILEDGLPNKKCDIYLEEMQGGRRIAWRSNGLPLEQDLQQPLADGAVIAVLDRTKWHL